MQKTKIEWADYSTNPLKYEVAGQPSPINLCVPISTGCKNCYATAIVKRFKKVTYGNEAMKDAKPVLIEKEIHAMLNFKPKPPFKNGRDRAAVFPCDMTDLFGPWVPDELLDRLFAVFAIRNDVDWLLLTKHPERMAEYCEQPGLHNTLEIVSEDYSDGHPSFGGKVLLPSFPFSNVWLGTSCEDQQRADERIPHLLRCPAAVRFISAEPLLGPIDIGEDSATFCHYAGEVVSGECEHGIGCRERSYLDYLDWVIIGGESGSGARLCDIDWIRSIVRQCGAAGVSCFVKQIGSKAEDWDAITRQPARGPHFSNTVRHPKGGDPAEWPEDVRVREMPRVAAVT